jgi:protein-S-isoprenylcysteine O-methyltransferase Ste14
LKPTNKGKNTGRILAFTQFFLIGIIFVFGIFEQKLFKYTTVPLLEYIGITLMIISGLVFVIAVFNFRQIITPNPVPLDNAKLITNGIYGYIRHPMYLFGILLMFGFAFYKNAYISVFLCILLIVFFIKKIIFEEKHLIQKFPQYKAYQSETKKLFPFIY